MATRPFFVTIPIVLTSNGTNTGEYDVGQGNTLTINRILQKASNTCDIIDISDSFGNKYGNMSTANPLDINIFTDILSDNNIPAQLPNPIVIENNGKLQFTIKETSGNAYTAYIYLQGLLSN